MPTGRSSRQHVQVLNRVEDVLEELAVERSLLRADRTTGASDESLDFVIGALSSGDRVAEARRVVVDEWVLTAPLSDAVVQVSRRG